MFNKIRNIFNKDYLELAVINKIVTKNGQVEIIPIKVIEGYYDKNNSVFIDKEGISYTHVIEGPESYGFSYRKNISSWKSAYPKKPLTLIKILILKTLNRFNFYYSYDVNTEVPCILRVDKTAKEGENKNLIILDDDIEDFYNEVFPGYLDKVLGKDKKEKEKEKEEETKEEININIDIKDLYNLITSSVIDQDEAIKKILTALWRQYRGFSPNKSRNIFINGSTGVGKTEIFRILTKALNVPCAIVTATEYTAAGYVGKSVDDMLISLLNKAGGNQELAEKGIIVIDEVDKLASEGTSSEVNKRDVQEALLKIIEDGTFDLHYQGKNVSFKTGNLMIVAMGSFSKINLEEKKVVGFENKSIKKEYKDITREDIIKNGMIPEFIGRFPVIVQMNELSLDSFVRILNNSKDNALKKNKEFLGNEGVELIVNDDTKLAIAKEAEKQKLGARSLDEIIENALSKASFEIAMNPNIYEKLIITPETINDNKKYKLVRKKKD